VTGDTIHSERYDKIVSLGTDCTVGLAFKARNVKAETYPFDWIVGHYRWVRAQFDARLPWPIDGDALEVYDPKNPHILADDPAGAYYYHDFTADRPVAEQLPAVQDKYRRRADRLNALLDSGDRVLFLRTHLHNTRYPEDVAAGTTAQIEELASVIEQRYPNADFRVLMLYSAEGDAPTHPRVTRIQVAGDKLGFREDVGAHLAKVLAHQPWAPVPEREPAAAAPPAPPAAVPAAPPATATAPPPVRPTTVRRLRMWFWRWRHGVGRG
jgi:hypothetical protein